ncbi:MAG: Ig-like domain-containing protein [Candidatus Limnocylindrales bacterium]
MTSTARRTSRLFRTALLVAAAMPVLAGVYVLSLRNSTRALRLAALGIALFVVGTFAMIRLVPQAEGHHPPPVDPPVIARLATPLVAGVDGTTPIDLSFSAPMNRDSVQAALTVTPVSGVELTWSAGDKAVSIWPLRPWSPSTVYTVVVGATARSATGAALAEPVRTQFLTADAPSATISAAATTGKRAGVAAGFRISFSRPVDLANLRAALSITPAADGQLTAGLQGGDPATVTWVPTKPLRPDTTYVVTFTAPVLSTDDMTVNPVPRLVVRTVAQPEVVRTRPANHGQGVSADASVSIRFSRPMNAATGQSAFRLVDAVRGTRVTGTFEWVEDDTVLVFNPAHALTAGRAYTLSIGTTATDKDGVELAVPSGATAMNESFRVAARHSAGRTAPSTKLTVKPAVVPAPKSATDSTSKPLRTPTPATATVTAPWISVEQYALELLNCTRTGGWVRSDGTCDGYGSGKYSAYVAPLTLSAGISTTVSRPYARYQAVRDACSHFLDGTPGDRLARAGYTSYRWAENIGCQTGTPRQVAVNSLTFFQSEKSYGGGHWVNLKNPAYSTVGIGVWDDNGYVLIVFDFYHP